MKRKIRYVLPLLLTVTLLALPAHRAYATSEDAGDHTDNQSEESQTEPAIPDAYYLPIQSNKTKDWPAGPQIEAEAAVVMDADTGTFLYSKNMEAKEYPASITKIMTTLVALEQGDLNSKIKFSEKAINSLSIDSSRLWMEVDEKITLKRGLYGVMLASANDCANGAAELVGGSIENFVDMMNEKAAKLGCINTHFVNTHGLHDEKHYTCAKDMALITQAAMKNDMFAEIAKTIEYSIPKTNKTKEVRYFLNHQKMLYDDLYYYEGCVGGKTGYTDAALNTLVTVAERDGRRLICVVLRTNGAGKTFTESAKLLDYGFDNFKQEVIEIHDNKLTRAESLRIPCWGQLALLQPQVLKEPLVKMADSIVVGLPKEADIQTVERKISPEGMATYYYQDWPLASTPISYNTFDIVIPKREILVPAVMPETETESETETAANILEQAGGMLQKAADGITAGWERAAAWLDKNDIAAAVIGLVFIVLLLPLLIISFIRNRSSQLIRRQRQKEREERIIIEKDIENKSVGEIEAELRLELEKERLSREREEERRQAAKQAEQEIAEAEKVIAEKETKKEAADAETEMASNLSEEKEE